MWSSVCAADICMRSRALPSGTTGNPKPMTKTPISSSRSDMRIAAAVSPTMIGRNRGWRLQHLVAEPAQPRTHAVDIRMQPGHALGFPFENLQGFGGATRHRGRQGVREQLRPATLDQVIDHVVRPRHIPTGGPAERLAQGPGENADPARTAGREVEVLGGPPAARTEHTDAVRIVDDQRGAEPATQVRHLGQPGHVALHAEDAVSHHERHRGIPHLRQGRVERGHIAVAKHLPGHLSRQACGVDDARVVQLVRNDRVSVIDEGSAAVLHWRSSSSRMSAPLRSPETRRFAVPVHDGIRRSRR